MAYSTISKPGLYFNTVTYSGTGSAQSITGVGFRPDWLWIKHREDVSNHKLQDVVRGSTKVIGSNEQAAESTVAQGVTSFDSDGFSLGTDASVNGTGAAGIVAWNWKAGTTSGLSGGTITPSSYSINTTSGFGIYKYTGTGSAGTIAHGLGSTPKMMIVKCTSHSDTWAVYHVNTGATRYMELDTNAAQQTSSVPWNDTEPTNSLFTVGTWSATNGSGKTYIAYCFAEKKGYSKFGMYTGNGSTFGTFIYTGFKPAWVMGKKKGGAANNWFIFDTVRDPFNLTQRKLRPDTTAAENNNSSKAIDILSNGFKIKSSDAEFNNNGSTYIYAAFAEEPLVANVGSSIPATAR